MPFARGAVGLSCLHCARHLVNASGNYASSSLGRHTEVKKADDWKAWTVGKYIEGRGARGTGTDMAKALFASVMDVDC